MKLMHVYLGRFSPFHLGHQAIVDKLLSQYGEDNCLILVGSSNAYNDRTPYTFSERYEMIKTVFPRISVMPLPDGKPNLKYFDGSTNGIWLKSIKTIEARMKAKFVFYGGSAADLEVLAQEFDTIVLLNRESNCHGVSATKVREALMKNDLKSLGEFLDPRIITFAISGYTNFKNSTNNEQN